MNPFSFFFFLLLLIITSTIFITFGDTLPIDDVKSISSRRMIIQALLPPELKTSTIGSLLSSKQVNSDLQGIKAIPSCYASSSLDIFNRSLPFSDVVQWYYVVSQLKESLVVITNLN